MSQFCSIKFSLNEAKFIQNYKQLQQNVPNLQLLNIIDAPSAQKGRELLSQGWFKKKILKRQNLFGINIKINQLIDMKCSEEPHFHELNFKKIFLIGFQSTVGSHESKTYWKVPNRNQIHSIYIDDDETEDITRFLQEFLTEEFKYKRTGSKILLIFNVFLN